MGERCIDFCVTMLCWAWFTLGFMLFFSWRYLGAALLAKERESTFQYLNSRFYQGLFFILQKLTPRHDWEIDPKVAAIRSSVIVCNHLSYLDPLLLIAVFAKHRTIVKTKFFRMPIMGQILQGSGYFPATAEGRFSGIMIRQMETMEQFLESGGNLFVFPEGTRSRDGYTAKLNQGALKIARACRVPVCALRLQGTDKLFTPGRFLFNTRVSNRIRLQLVTCIGPEEYEKKGSMDILERQIRTIYRQEAR